MHALWDKFLAILPVWSHPWAGIAPQHARAQLRTVLSRLRVPEAASYRSHDFRRGHAEDMRQNGSTLAQILIAGQRRSAALLRYLDEADLEKDVAYAVAVQSEDEEWID